MQPKTLLIIQPATSYDDLPDLCASRGDEVAWFRDACGIAPDRIASVRVYAGEPLPDPSDVGAAIITGAIDMVTDNHPWIADTAEWVVRAVGVGTPVLGVCFGHQLMAHAFGGRVGQNPNGAAFGSVPVMRAQGAPDPLFDALPDTMEMMAFHYQSVLDLPEGAVPLATSINEPYYAVRYADSAWGVQFHPEFDDAIMEGSIDVYAGDMEAAGFDVDALRAQDRSDPSGYRLLRRFVEHAGLASDEDDTALIA